ncbi:SDR family NAD(P)-dependent oxidoreductase [Wenjunlia tyrosinilytica]|uniref:SDR family NAD(P)-dependent oxidoreductase n=1 Tax=Wenjunlia tyrosinilytica TaxID=1544741 RepID=A0A918DZ71_9ACTN|nr:SDR family NAD(P)-dependent oxidoreductase [Wenjunlia tyrosinilytica]GGO93065.1 hypothetical protein GCM10012280_44690 [Wenjunlia tyrosinilytica]
MDPPPDHGETSYGGSGLLQGQAAVITGGGFGIGRAVALAFAREGADILFTHLPEEKDGAHATVGPAWTPGARPWRWPATSATRTAAEVIDMAVAEFGRLDILVNSAAYRDAAPLSDGGGPG